MYGLRWNLAYPYALPSWVVMMYDLLSCSTLVMIAGYSRLHGSVLYITS